MAQYNVGMVVPVPAEYGNKVENCRRGATHQNELCNIIAAPTDSNSFGKNLIDLSETSLLPNFCKILNQVCWNSHLNM